jgi:integrase
MAKRKYNEGSVFRRKDGRYVAQVRLENGKKKQRYFQTQKEANAARRKMLHEKEQGTLPVGPQQTLKTYLDQWLEQVHKPTIRIGSYNAYRIMLDKHIIPALGHIPLQRLNPQQLQAFYASKLNEGLSLRRVRGLHSVLHSALAIAMKWNLVGRNVCDLVSPPVPKRHEIQPLTLEQAQRLLQAAREHKLETLLTLALATGMRRGELLGLRWQDVDFEAGCLHVRRSVGRTGRYGLIESEPKTERSRRTIVLPAFVLAALKQHQQHQRAMRADAGNKWQEHDIVFCGRNGTYFDLTSLDYHFKKLLKSAELPNIRFHDLRHSAATILLGRGVHPKVVQELLGHSTISMTLDIYSHVLPSIQQEAMSKLDDLFGGQEQV